MAKITVDVQSQQAVFAANTRGRTLLNPYHAPAKMRATYFYYKNETGGDLTDGTVIDFGPILRSSLHLPIVILTNTALGASRTLDLGWQEYIAQDGTTVTGDIDGILDGVDVSSALNGSVVGMVAGLLDVTGDAVHLLGQVNGGTIPDKAVISGYLISMNPF